MSRRLKLRRNQLRWRRKYLHAQVVQKLKQNQEDFPLLAHLQNCTHSWNQMDWFGTGAQFHYASPVAKDLTLFLSMDNHLEKKIGRSNSGEKRCGKIWHSQHWSDEMWNSKMARGGGNKKDFNIPLDHQSKNSLISELNIIQNSMPLILHFRTMWKFRSISSSTFSTLDGAINLHSTNSGLIMGGRNSGRDRQTVFCTAVIPWRRITKNLMSLTWPNHVLHDASRKWKRTQDAVHCIDFHLAQRKDWSSIRHDRTLLFFTMHSQLIVSRKLLWWKLEKSFTKECISVTSTITDNFLQR